jgi:hypothetical protein
VGQPLQHTTLVASQRALRTFFAWADQEGYVIDGRILKLRKPRVAQRDATVYTLAQLDAILAECASPTEELAIRLPIGTGVRLCTARSATPCTSTSSMRIGMMATPRTTARHDHWGSLNPAGTPTEASRERG